MIVARLITWEDSPSMLTEYKTHLHRDYIFLLIQLVGMINVGIYSFKDLGQTKMIILIKL